MNRSSPAWPGNLKSGRVRPATRQPSLTKGDEDLLRRLDERLRYLRNLEERRGEVRQLIAAQEKLTSEIELALGKAQRLQEIEDIYLPFRPKWRTRAGIAREKGLAPLAELILEQAHTANLTNLLPRYHWSRSFRCRGCSAGRGRYRGRDRLR